jgi:hypothetical protein
MRSHPHEKTGRNDPCPCGSGKKYKHCCFASGPASISAPDFQDTPWSRQRDASDRITADLFKVVGREFGDDLLEAWADFNQTYDTEPLSKMPEEITIFNPYLLFEWDPEQRARRSGGKPKAGAVARSYMEKRAHQLSELELLLLHQAISRPVSFYEVVRSDPGHGVRLRDLLIGEETEVEEHSASLQMRPGDLAYGQIWILPEVATLGRLAPRVIRPDNKVKIVKLRAQLRKKIANENRELNADDLLRYNDEIRIVYLDIRDAQLRPPVLQNTDGELIHFHTLTYRIESAQLAFDALAPLAWHITKEDLLDEAELDKNGALQNVEIPWSKKGNKLHDSWENTILGHLKIDGRVLVVEVNSAQRAEKIRHEIERRLGMHATLLDAKKQTPEESVKERKRLGSTAAEKEEEEDLPFPPEVMKELAAQMQTEVEAWVHTKVPALGGRTPMQAVADPDGREIVEALLLGWERHFEKPGSPGAFRPDIDAVRRLLGLAVDS